MRALPLALALAVLPAPQALAQSPGAPPQPPPQLARYLEARARDPRNPYWAFAVLQTARRLKLEPPELPGARDPRAWGPQLYELTTGAAAVQEALQLDRMLGAGDAQAAAAVPVDSVAGVGRPSIPFDKLLEGRQVQAEPLAKCAPQDWYYAHFPSVPAMRRVLEASDRWGTHLLSSYELTGRDAHLRRRLEDRLLLRPAPELDPFYQLVVGDVAVVGSDPFFFEGSDVTLIFALRSAPLFLGRMELARREAAPGNARVVSEQYRGWHVDGIVSADRSVSSFAAARGDVALVGTSLPALRRVIDTVNGSAPSLAAAPDFRYARSVYPYAADSEDGFLFLSDGFVRRVVGPRVKIGEARRVRCAVSLQAAAYGSMLFRTERGEAPASLEEVIVRGYLDRSALRCPEGGQYALASGVPRCSLHGSLGALTPNVETPIERVTRAEADAYAEFREGYENYWRRYVDPVAVRARAGERLEVEATILPLVENSAYRSLQAAVGGAPAELAPPRLPSAVAAADARIDLAGPDGRALLPGLVDAQVADLARRGLGDVVTVQVADSAPLVAPGVASGLGVMFAGDFGFLAPLVTALMMPVAFAAPVRDRAALEAALAGLRADIGRGRMNDRFLSVSGYELVEDGAPPVEAVVVDVFGFRVRVYYGIVGDTFVVANRRELVAEAGASPRAEPATANLRFEVSPGRWQALRPAMELAYSEDARAACHANLSWVEALSLAFREPPAALADESLRLTGFEFACPGGGVYAVTGGVATCDVHGSLVSPRQPARPRPGSPAAFVLESVERLSAALSFTPEGISARVVVEPKK